VRPRGFLHAGKNHSLVGAGRTLFRPDVPVAIFRLRIASCFLKPRVFVRCVIDDEIDDHADAALLRTVREFDKIADRANAGLTA
jgi:hypothetical protein